MAGTDPNTDDEVHVLQADEPASRRGALSPILAGVALLAVAGAGVWLWLHPELLEGLGGTTVKTAPPPAEGNLLGDAWSFETTETTSASQAWRVPEEAPGGFRFLASGAVSGELGAVADPSLPAGESAAGSALSGGEAAGEGQGDGAGSGAGGGEAAGWCRMVSDRAIPLGVHRGAVRYGGRLRGAGLQLFLRFEAAGRRPIDIVVAQGAEDGDSAEELRGQALVPPGMSSVRAGLQCVGPGSADDLSLELVPAEGAAPERRGIFDVLSLRDGVLVFRGDQCVFTVNGLAVADARGAVPPPGVGQPGVRPTLLLPDGRVLARRVQAGGEAPRLQLTESVDGMPAGVPLVRTLVIDGALAEAALGVVSQRGFEQFTDDFRVEGVRSLVLGHTQDRLALDFDADTIVGATWQTDGTVLVRAELPGQGGGAVQQVLTVQTSFQEERVAAAQHRDAALAAEQAGRLGAALADAELIVTRYPHDEEVLAIAQAVRGRVQAQMRERLDVIDRGLADALFLDSASRCREVLAECNAAATTFEGSEEAQRFVERAQSVEQRAASLLEEDRARRADRLSAVAASFREAGGFDHVVAELEDTLARFLPPPGAAGQPAGADENGADANGADASDADGGSP